MKRNYFLFIGAILLFSSSLTAQIPSEVPKPSNNSPIDLSKTADIILYIVLPALILLLAILRYRKGKK